MYRKKNPFLLKKLSSNSNTSEVISTQNAKIWSCSPCSSSYSFVCEKCEVPEVFHSRSSFRDHEIRYHDRKGQILKCKFEGCRLDFTNPALLRAHQRTHTDERPFECPYCQSRFKTKFHMENHAKRHTKGELLFYKHSHLSNKHQSFKFCSKGVTRKSFV